MAEEHRMMRIAVLGATGPSGKQVVEEGLDQGHQVTALVRNPDKLTQTHERLSVHKVDILDAESMVEHLRGQDVVISCLGCEPSWFNRQEIRFYTDTVRPIVAAMKTAEVSRFIFMSSWYSKYNRDDPVIINWIFKPLLLGRIVHNMGEMEDYLTSETEGIEFTSVRCPQLLNRGKSGKPVIVEEGQSAPGAGYTISRRDVAVFMLNLAAHGGYERKCISIGVNKSNYIVEKRLDGNRGCSNKIIGSCGSFNSHGICYWRICEIFNSCFVVYVCLIINCVGSSSSNIRPWDILNSWCAVYFVISIMRSRSRNISIWEIFNSFCAVYFYLIIIAV